MTQDEFKLFTGESADQYTTEQWTRIVNVALTRLASFLCIPMDDLPETLPDDFKMLLANFISATIAHEGSTGAVQRKAVRNFTIEFAGKSATDAFAQIANDYGDIIEMYSNCKQGFTVESSARFCCGR